MINCFGFCPQMNINQLLEQEYKICENDDKIATIGCSLAHNDDYTHWEGTMLGPTDSPYAGGIFYIDIFFPPDYPAHGPEFKFKNYIYHLNVEKETGHICLSRLNQWKTQGYVDNYLNYNVSQALVDIFYLFYDQGTMSPHNENMSYLYLNNREEFDKNVKECVQKSLKNSP